MRILFIAPIISIHSKRWIKYFANKKYDVHVIDTLGNDNVKIDNVQMHPFKPYKKRYPLIIDYFIQFIPIKNKLKNLIQDIQPDIIQIHWIDIHAYIVARCVSRPVIVTAWGSDILVLPKKYKIYKYIVKKVLKSADIITCDAIHLKNEIIRIGANKDNVKKIYFGTDLTEYNPLNKDKNIKKELGYNSSDRIIISSRSLEPIYNISTLIRTLPLVLEEISNVRFIIVGDGSERQYLEKLSHELKVENNINFVGRLSFEDLKKYIASADIYVSTSLSDAGLAASTAEAMASEVPVIVTDFGDNRDWVEDGVSGLIFKSKNYRMLADKIIYLLNNKELSDKISINGRKIIEKRNNWHVEMKKVEELYIETISKHK